MKRCCYCHHMREYFETVRPLSTPDILIQGRDIGYSVTESWVSRSRDGAPPHISAPTGRCQRRWWRHASRGPRSQVTWPRRPWWIAPLCRQNAANSEASIKMEIEGRPTGWETRVKWEWGGSIMGGARQAVACEGNKRGRKAERGLAVNLSIEHPLFSPHWDCNGHLKHHNGCTLLQSARLKNSLWLAI